MAERLAHNGSRGRLCRRLTGNAIAAATMLLLLARFAMAQQSHFWLQADPAASQLGSVTNPSVNLRVNQSTTLYLWLKPVGVAYGFDGISFDIRLIAAGTGSAAANLAWDMPAGRWSSATTGATRTDSGGTGVDDANTFDLTNTDTLDMNPLRLAAVQISAMTPGTVKLYLCIGRFGIADGGANSVVWLGFNENQAAAESLNISGGVANLCSNVAEATITVMPEIPDWDLDGDVDQEDFGRFQACLSGLAVAQTDPDCGPALLDEDTDVDQNDLIIFRNCLSGPNQSADTDCVQN